MHSIDEATLDIAEALQEMSRARGAVGSERVSLLEAARGAVRRAERKLEDAIIEAEAESQNGHDNGNDEGTP